MRGIILAFALLLALFACPVNAIDSTKAALVTHVDGLGKYIRSEGVYVVGDTVTVYAEVSDVNHFRAYAVDFVFIVYDPENYPVSGGVVRKEGTGWTDSVYATYRFGIQEGWKTGEYRVEVYVFDVLNSTATKEEYDSFLDRLIKGGSAGISVHTLARDDVDYEMVELKFRVVESHEGPLYVFDSGLKASTLPEGMGNTMYVSVLNYWDRETKFYAKLLADGTVVDRKKVVLGPYESKRIEFSVPPLENGTHRLEIAFERENVVMLKTLPIIVGPYLFSKPVLVSEAGKGSVVLSLNNYVLGAGGVSGMDTRNPAVPEEPSVNFENAAKMITNVLAYLWKDGRLNGEVRVGLYYRSDERAEKVVPELVDYISRTSKAPLSYVGVIYDDNLGDADVLFYVTDNPSSEVVDGFAKSGGVVFVDITDYYFNPSHLVKKYGLKEDGEILRAFYDLTAINRTVEVKLRTELNIGPQVVYSNLSVGDFIVEVGKPVKISFDIRNEGGPGEENVFVRINGEVVFNQTLKLSTNEMRHIEFEFIPKKEGAYKVLLDDTAMSKVFFAKNFTKTETVAVTPTPEEKTVKRGDATLITALAALLAILIIVRMYLK